MWHRHVSADLLGNLDTFCHLLVLAFVLRHLLAHLLGLVFTNLLGNLLTGRCAIARFVRMCALLLVNCFTNFLLVIFANIVVDGLAFLLQLFFAFYILALPALCFHHIFANLLDIIRAVFHLKKEN